MKNVKKIDLLCISNLTLEFLYNIAILFSPLETNERLFQSKELKDMKKISHHC